MLRIENCIDFGWEGAMRGMRNPKNSWAKSDSGYLSHEPSLKYQVGPNDLKLATTLIKAGSDHRKFLRMIHVQVDCVAPLYWWKEFDTYKVGTTANSCSTMHKLLAKPFEMDDFSFDQVLGDTYERVAMPLVDVLNELRDSYFDSNNKSLKKVIWYTIIQILPESYNQRRTLDLDYETLLRIYFARKDHKLEEWHVFTDWVESLPYMGEFLSAAGKEEDL